MCLTASLTSGRVVRAGLKYEKVEVCFIVWLKKGGKLYRWFVVDVKVSYLLLFNALVGGGCNEKN